MAQRDCEALTPSSLAPGENGQHQSPVNIETSKTKYSPPLADNSLGIKYLSAPPKTLSNKGHCVQVRIDGQGSYLQGGPLKHAYQAEQFHFHWGKISERGSEHRVDRKVYSAELHIVHWNTKYPSFDEAAKRVNGLAVLGVFLECGAEHPSLKKLTDLFKNIPCKGNETKITEIFDPISLLPKDKTKYWTYEGSLTTAPYYESVQWIIFKEPIKVSELQLDAFRELYSTPNKSGGRIGDNCRDVQPLNGRVILRSFE